MKSSLAERFAQKFIPASMTECWNWIGGMQHEYGCFRVNSKSTWHAHRVMWMIENGSIPKGLWVLHKCDNPKCVNPNHLFLGTHQDNMDDMNQKGRRACTDGFKNPNARVSRDQILLIRELRKTGMFYKDIAKRVGCGYGTVERHCKYQTRHPA